MSGKYRTADARSLWTDVTTRFDLERQEEVLLDIACRSLDRLRAAERLVERDGMLLPDDHGILRRHPALLIASEARTAARAAIRQLAIPGAEKVTLDRHSAAASNWRVLKGRAG